MACNLLSLSRSLVPSLSRFDLGVRVGSTLPLLPLLHCGLEAVVLWLGWQTSPGQRDDVRVGGQVLELWRHESIERSQVLPTPHPTREQIERQTGTWGGSYGYANAKTFEFGRILQGETCPNYP